jgi:hypothetical protein
VLATAYACHEGRSGAEMDSCSDLVKPVPEGDRHSAASRRGDSVNSVAFLIGADGVWLQQGTQEVERYLSRSASPPTLDNAIGTSGFIGIEYTRRAVRVRLDPSTVVQLALASLRPRLSVIESPVMLTFHPAEEAQETCASGAIAMGRIEAVVQQYRGLALEEIAGSIPLVGRHLAGAPTIDAGSYMVSYRGEWLREADPRLKAEIGFTDPTLDAIGFAVRNLGYVKVSLGEPGTATIALHPRNAGSAAILSVVQRLERMDLAGVELRTLGDEGWVSEGFPNGAAALRRMKTLCRIEAETQPKDRWYLTSLTPAELLKEDANALRLMHQKWRISFGTFNESVFSFAMQHGLLGRLILAGAKRPDADLVFRYIGDDFGTFYSDEFRFNAIGNSVMQQPDRDYGEWVGAAYKAVAETGMPRFDYIDAYLPGSSRGPWIRYERLLLPWKLTTGERLVSISSRIKSDRMLTRPS